MPRDEEKDEQKDPQPPHERRGDAPNVGHTPTKAEGDEETVDQALRKRREMEH